MALKRYYKTHWNDFAVFQVLIKNKKEQIRVLKKLYYKLYECLSIYIMNKILF